MSFVRDLVKRGEYVTRAADCAGCHTNPGGKPFAGGRAFALPFGVLYSPNITPDQATGIAGYSDDDWVRMLHEGVGRGGKHLYPAMPYPSYTLMSREDALAVKAYLLSLAPVSTSVPENRIRFPFNQRWGLIFWNLLNNRPARGVICRTDRAGSRLGRRCRARTRRVIRRGRIWCRC